MIHLNNVVDTINSIRVDVFMLTAITVSGNRKTLKGSRRFLIEYNMQSKKLAELTELDKAIYLAIHEFAKII